VIIYSMFSQLESYFTSRISAFIPDAILQYIHSKNTYAITGIIITQWFRFVLLYARKMIAYTETFMSPRLTISRRNAKRMPIYLDINDLPSSLIQIYSITCDILITVSKRLINIYTNRYGEIFYIYIYIYYE